tara:strand:+ start:2000 stop:2131 length:132 start_codon:yes stop_codon:yes gene_type:complete
MKLLAARLFFFLARILLRRGMPLGQWFQGKGILLLAGVKVKRD